MKRTQLRILILFLVLCLCTNKMYSNYTVIITNLRSRLLPFWAEHRIDNFWEDGSFPADPRTLLISAGGTGSDGLWIQSPRPLNIQRRAKFRPFLSSLSFVVTSGWKVKICKIFEFDFKRIIYPLSSKWAPLRVNPSKKTGFFVDSTSAFDRFPKMKISDSAISSKFANFFLKNLK